MRVSNFLALAFAVFLIWGAHQAEAPSATKPVAPVVKTQADRLLLIVDVSGSMAGQKLALAQEAVKNVARGMPATAVVGLRSFSHKSQILSAPELGSGERVASSVRLMRAFGGTDIGSALEAAADDIEKVDREVAAGRLGRERAGKGPWTFILVSDGEGRQPAADIAMARQLSLKYPDLTCHTIGIELRPQGRAELEKIAEILRGRNWSIGRHELGMAMQEAASLAGFSMPSSTGSTSASGREALPAAVAVLMLLAVALLAGQLRGRVSEGAYTVVMSIGAGAGAWLASTFLLPSTGTSQTLVALAQNGAYFMFAGTAFGVTLAASEGLFLSDGRRARSQAASALPVGVFGGALAGFFGQLLFAGFRWFAGGHAIVAYGTRVLGWATAGMLIGLCPGISGRSWERSLNGAVGGAMGGTIGGALFEWLMRDSGTPGASRLAALVSLAVAIGLMVRVVEQMRKAAWLVIVSGGPEGKQFIVDKDETIIGSHFQDDVVVANDRRQPFHEAVLLRRGASYELQTLEGGKAEVNGSTITSRRLLSGDLLQIGGSVLEFQLRDAPQDEEGAGPDDEGIEWVKSSQARDDDDMSFGPLNVQGGKHKG